MGNEEIVNEEVNISNSIEKVELESENTEQEETIKEEIVEEDIQKSSNQLPEKPKNKKALVIALIIIIFSLLGVCGYFVWDKYLKNNDNEKLNGNVTPTPSITPDVTPSTKSDESENLDNKVFDNEIASQSNSGLNYYIYCNDNGYCYSSDTISQYWNGNYETYECKSYDKNQCKVYSSQNDKIVLKDYNGYYIYYFENKKYVKVNIDNDLLVSYINYINNDYLSIKLQNEKYGIFDIDGNKLLIDYDYDDIVGVFLNDKLYGFSLKKNEKYGFYDLATKKLVFDFQYDNGFYTVEKQNYLFNGTNSNTINIYDSKTFELKKTITGGKGLYYSDGYYILTPEDPYAQYLGIPPTKDILNSNFDSIFSKKEFNGITDYVINDDKTIVIQNGVDYNNQDYVAPDQFYIYDSEGYLILESKKYTKIYKIVKDYAIVNDNKQLKIINMKDKEVANLVTLTDDMYVHSMKSGWYTDNGKNGIYVVVEFDGFGKVAKGREYYYIPTTGETGSIELDEIGGYAKPVLYLYPEEETKVALSFEKTELLTTTYPKYKNNWVVTAKPNGDLYDTNGKYYYGLYWEEKGSTYIDFSEGYYVTKEAALEFLEEKCEEIGLTRREANEFIMYWLPILEKNEKNLVYFELTQSRDNYNKLHINPKPDSLLRMAIHVKKVDKEYKIKPQQIPKFERTGFVAVEWGGVIH